MKKTSAESMVVFGVILVLVLFLLVMSALFFITNSIGEGAGFLVVALSLVFIGVMYHLKSRIADSSAMIIGKKLEEAMKKKISPIQTNSSFTGEVVLEMLVNININKGEIEEMGEIRSVSMLTARFIRRKFALSHNAMIKTFSFFIFLILYQHTNILVY